MTGAGFPHSEIFGSKRACRSPKLIAACCVLRRLMKPRHPSIAVTGLCKRSHILGVYLTHLHLTTTLNFQRTKLFRSHISHQAGPTGTPAFSRPSPSSPESARLRPASRDYTVESLCVCETGGGLKLQTIVALQTCRLAEVILELSGGGLMLNVFVQHLNLVALFALLYSHQISHRKHADPTLAVDYRQVTRPNQFHPFQGLMRSLVAPNHRAQLTRYFADL